MKLLIKTCALLLAANFAFAAVNGGADAGSSNDESAKALQIVMDIDHKQRAALEILRSILELKISNEKITSSEMFSDFRHNYVSEGRYPAKLTTVSQCNLKSNKVTQLPNGKYQVELVMDCAYETTIAQITETDQLIKTPVNGIGEYRTSYLVNLKDNSKEILNISFSTAN